MFMCISNYTFGASMFVARITQAVKVRNLLALLAERKL